MLGLLKSFVAAIYTNRGKNIYDTSLINKINRYIRELKISEDFPLPFHYILDRIEKKLAGFQQDDIMNGFAAVKWCIDHHLIQQAYTILLENIISKILSDIKIDIYNREFRESVSGAIFFMKDPRKFTMKNQNQVEIISKIAKHKLFKTPKTRDLFIKK